MDLFPRGVLANSPPGSPLVGNNAVFYTAFGSVLLVVLLVILWLRRGRK